MAGGGAGPPTPGEVPSAAPGGGAGAGGRARGGRLKRGWVSLRRPGGERVGGGWGRGGPRGENMAGGTGAKATAAQTHGAWMPPPPHPAIILRRSFREIGIGIALGSPAVS